MKIKTLSDIDVKDKLVLLRIDINSPVVKGKVEDNPRFEQSAITVKELLKNNARVVILAHQGRKGDRDFIPLKQHSEILGRYVGKQIKYVDGLFEEHALKEIIELEAGKAILLKNVREYEDELTLENNRFYGFAEGFDIYINDAFSVSHRKQGSIIIPPKVIPSCMGRGFEREINALSKFTINNMGKGVYLLGGQKVEDYLPLFNVLTNKNNKILASGVLANLILIANGKDLGYENKWMKEKGYDKLLPKLKELYNKYLGQIILPVDFAVGNPDINKAKRKEISINDFPTNEKVWDVGSKTVELFKQEMKSAKVIFMKGPLGYSEIKDFLFGTLEILKEVSKLSKQGTFSLLGGGHLTTTAEKHKISGFGYVSLSGGALIAFVSGENLPGLESLEKGIEK